MRLEPILLVAPESELRPSGYSRRSLIGSWIAGATIGLVFGRSLAGYVRSPSIAKPDSSGDESWIRWAEAIQDGEVDLLWSNRFQFLTIVSLGPGAARRLAKGMTRLTGSLRDRTSSTTQDDAVRLARALLQVVETSALSPNSLLAPSDLRLLRDLVR